MPYNTEDMQFFADSNANGLIARIGRFQPHAVGTAAQAFHGVLTIDRDHDDGPVDWVSQLSLMQGK